MTRPTSHSPALQSATCNASRWLVALAVCAALAGGPPTNEAIPTSGARDRQAVTELRSQTHHAGTPHAEASPDDQPRLDCRLPVQGYPFGPAATMPGSSTEERRSRGQVRAGEREPQARECPSHRRTPPLLKVAGSTPAPAIKDRQGTAATPSGDAVLAALPRPHPLALMLSQRCGPFCECLCCHDDRARRYALLAFLAEGC